MKLNNMKAIIVTLKKKKIIYRTEYFIKHMDNVKERGKVITVFFSCSANTRNKSVK